MNKDISHEISLRVRYHEVDRMGFLHHSRYLTYFEIGRTELLRQSGLSYKEFEEKKLFLVVANVTVKYKYPIRYDDIVRIETRVENMTPAKIQHSYEIWSDNKTRLHATGKSTLACVDTNGQVQRIPDFLQTLSYPNQS